MTRSAKTQAVAVAVVLRDGRVLVQRRLRHDRGMVFEFPCGSTDEDETIEDAAMRELFEETGLPGCEYVATVMAEGIDGRKLGFVVLRCPADRNPRVTNPAREQTFFWFTPEEIPVKDFKAADREFIRSKLKEFLWSCHLKSLALLTDLISQDIDTEISANDKYLAFKTSSHPHYFWGNFMFFFKPPAEGDLEVWKELYRREYCLDRPDFYTFTWDVDGIPPRHAGAFTDAGFNLGVDLTLTTDSPVKPPKFNDRLKIRIMESQKEWDMIPAVHIDPDSPKSVDSQQQFIRKRLKAFKQLADRGIGLRFGAFLDGMLVGDLGICHRAGTGRFNLVATHPEYLRQGVCQTLVYTSSLYMFENFNVSRLVIVADNDYHAAGVYRKAGFEPVQTKLQPHFPPNFDAPHRTTQRPMKVTRPTVPDPWA